MQIILDTVWPSGTLRLKANELKYENEFQFFSEIDLIELLLVIQCIYA